VTADASAMRPKLSVLLVCYNQESFVERAARSILAQEMPEGGVEIVVADDFSTDGTLRVLRQVLEGACWPVRVLETPHNLGITRNYERAFPACRGNYVAVLEGDDYWTCPTKLQEQIAFLESHQECSAVCTNHLVHDVSRAAFSLKFDQLEGYSYIDARRLIRGNEPGNFSTFLYRREALLRLPRAIFEERSYDWIVNICVALEGPIGLLHRPMSVYRQHAGGAWSQLSRSEKAEQQIAAMLVYDRLTDGKLHDAFEDRIDELLAEASEEEEEPLVRTATLRQRWRNPAHRRRVAIACVPPFLILLCRGLVPPILPLAARKVVRAFRRLTSREARRL
jgi:hypothetical protein